MQFPSYIATWPSILPCPAIPLSDAQILRASLVSLPPPPSIIYYEPPSPSCLFANGLRPDSQPWPRPPPPPLSYGVLLYPGFEVLDVAGPLECLNTLADCLPSSKLTLSIIGRPIATDRRVPMPLSPANPNEGPPASQPSNSFTFKASQVYLPTHTFDTAPPLDVLILGGGLGSLPTDQVQPEMDFLQSVFPSLKYLFTVCTGSGIAARAGLLDGLRATSNKAVWKQVVACGPKTHWVARARWVVDGNMKVWTTSGVSAGVDGMVSFLRHVYPEEEHPGLVQKVVDYMEYRHEPDPSNDPFADVFGAHDVLPKA